MTCRFDDSAHFHIHWSDKENLDWECFDTHEEAVSRARELVLPGEIFKVEEVFAACPLREEKDRQSKLNFAA